MRWWCGAPISIAHRCLCVYSAHTSRTGCYNEKSPAFRFSPLNNALKLWYTTLYLQSTSTWCDMTLFDGWRMPSNTTQMCSGASMYRRYTCSSHTHQVHDTHTHKQKVNMAYTNDYNMQHSQYSSWCLKWVSKPSAIYQTYCPSASGQSPATCNGVTTSLHCILTEVCRTMYHTQACRLYRNPQAQG